MYIMTQTYPELIYSISILNKFFVYSSKEHTVTLKQVYYYLQRTKFLSLIYQGNYELKLMSYTNFD